MDHPEGAVPGAATGASIGAAGKDGEPHRTAPRSHSTGSLASCRPYRFGRESVLAGDDRIERRARQPRLEPDSRAPSAISIVRRCAGKEHIATDEALCERLSFVAAGEQITDIVTTLLNC